MEMFECRACYHRGPLTIRGACEVCGSFSVISEEVLTLGKEYWLAVRSDRKPLQPNDFYGPMGLA